MPEQLVPDRSGLISKDDAPVALAGVSIAADVRGLCAKVTVAQRYINRETRPIEAVYVFPLDEGAAVCGFEAIIDGTLVVGEVKERDEAFRIYDDAMEAGHGAYLLDEERPDVFQASVGNLPPGKEVLLKITYVTEVDVDSGSLRFVVPTTVSPRYAPQIDRVGVGRPDAETLNPAVAWSVPYGLELSARIAMPGGTARVESPSHPISVVTDGSAVVVSLAQQQAALDRDFVLSVSASALDVPRAWLERSDDGREAVAVAFVPRIDATPSPAEVIFVIDRSGSMGGSSIEEVRNALQLCLRSMMTGCRFNIVGFGSTHEALFPESQPYDERSLAAASAHAASLDADLGGTEILPALQSVLEQKHNGLPRQVVVLTDGQVTNTEAVLDLVRSHTADTRVFSFGIGAGSSRHLVQGMARAGGGSAEFIAPGERIEPKVVRLVNRLLTPALTDVRVDWGGLSVVAAPSMIPPVFTGARLVVYGFVERSPSATLRLSGTAPAGPVSFDVPLDPQSAVAGSVVSTLAARARIRELEESPAWLSTRGSRQQRARTSDVSREIIDLAVRYSLISRETSFVRASRAARARRRAAASHPHCAHERVGRSRANGTPCGDGGDGRASDGRAGVVWRRERHGGMAIDAAQSGGRRSESVVADGRPDSRPTQVGLGRSAGGSCGPDVTRHRAANARTEGGGCRSRKDVCGRVTAAGGRLVGSDRGLCQCDRSAARQAQGGASRRLGRRGRRQPRLGHGARAALAEGERRLPW
jgi:Ca-activated chloride channel homolog